MEGGKRTAARPNNQASPPPLNDPRFSQIALLVAIVLIAVKVSLLLYYAWNTRFVMDEFVQLGHAKYIGNGYFASVWPVKAIGYAIFYKGAHLLGWDAVSTLLIGRLQTAFIGAMLLLVVYAIARRIEASNCQALLILLILLSFSNFIERIFRTRSEPLAVFIAALALLIIIWRSEPSSKRIILAGVVSGLAFVTTQKSIYFNVALGLGLLLDAVLQRKFIVGTNRGALLALGWLISVGAYCLALGGVNAPIVGKNLFLGPLNLATNVADNYDNLRGYVGQTLQRNIFLYIICFTGLVTAATTIQGRSFSQRVAVVFSFTIAVFVFLHDQPWPYVFVMALPFVALWAPVPLRDKGLPSAISRVRTFTIFCFIFIGVAVSFVRNVNYLHHDNSRQLSLVSAAEALLAPEDIYFDGVGMIPTRGEPSTLWLDRTAVMSTLADGDRSEAFAIVQNGRPKIILWSYRLDAIESVIGSPVSKNYVRIAPNLWVSGARLRPGDNVSLRVGRDRLYGAYDSSGMPVDGAMIVDGKKFFSVGDFKQGEVSVEWLGLNEVFILPVGDYSSVFDPMGEDVSLFDGVYR